MDKLIIWATRQRDEAHTTAINIRPTEHNRPEETIQWWLGRRDAFNALLTHLKSSPLSEPQNVG